jgi:hypothetical protein
MQLIAPDILAEARGLTGAMAGTICLLGVALWLFGWRWHRFWIVAGITLAAGLIGLNAGRASGGTQVMAVGILLAVAAGLLALELAKVLAFVAGGCGAWLAVQWVLPQAQELWAVFLSGGLLSLFLYRLWTMLLTSLIGTLFAGHAAVILVEQSSGVNAIGWVGQNVAALNGLVVGLVVLGILIQAASAPVDEPSVKAREEKSNKKDKKEKPKHSDGSHDHGHDHGAAHADGHAPHPHSPPKPEKHWLHKLFPPRHAA